MTTLTDRIIDSLQAHHDELATFVAGLSDEQLGSASGAAEWSIADVLSHLGSGAEIMGPRFAAGVAGEAPPDVDNQAIWDRWNATAPRAQAEGFVEQDRILVDLATRTTSEQRDTARIDLGFLPQPVSLATAGGMRLNEVAAHAWDMQVGLDPEATLDADAAAILPTCSRESWASCSASPARPMPSTLRPRW